MCIRTGQLGGGAISYAMIIMWCPAIAALLTCRIRKIPIASLGWKWGLTKYQLLAFAIPLLYSLIPYLVVWISGAGGFYNHEFVAETAKGMGWNLPDGLVIFLYILLMGSFGMIRSMSSALGEEIGWRGFLLPNWQNEFLYIDFFMDGCYLGSVPLSTFCFFPTIIQVVQNGWH